ncbi:MAG: replicative helicase loader/inhibitor [Turicibacter sp.]|nr:replicative helicase loader/inhibitor [Turicibacter sp.]
MSKKEMQKFLAIMQLNYTNFHKEKNAAELERIAELWANMLADLDVVEVKQAFYDHMKTSAFPPTFADIIDAVKASQSRQRQIARDAQTLKLVQPVVHSAEQLELNRVMRIVVKSVMEHTTTIDIQPPPDFDLIDRAWVERKIDEAKNVLRAIELEGRYSKIS